MKLLTIQKGNTRSLGIKVNDGIIDVAEALEMRPKPGIKADIMSVIQDSPRSLVNLSTYVNELDLSSDAPYLYNESTIRFGPAITHPSKIICVGLNYKKHADETKLPYPDTPILFNKFPNALSGHLNEVIVPKTTERLDYEVELGIIIGKKAKNVTEENALDFVFGYCTANDLSARDLQKRTSQWMLGKTNDGFAPVGPYIVTKEEVSNPNNLQLTTIFNGEVRQHSNTADMIFSCEQLISYISNYMTLVPGDVILTGTPEGVIIGKPIEERVYIKPGDEVSVEVGNLGKLTTYFARE